MMLGLRGFPDVQGGVETHVEHVCERLVAREVEVDVIVRRCYMENFAEDSWQGSRFHRVWSPKSKGLEAIVHTFLGVLYAAVKRPDILHIQAIGPAIMTPLACLLGLKVVVTHHGPDYDRQKWGFFAKTVLKLGERFGMRYSNQPIVISKTIQSLVKSKHGVESVRIPNGVVLPDIAASSAVLDQFGLERGRYVLMVTRLVPEKRHLDLINGFVGAGLDGWKLAIVGASDHPDAYTQDVLDTAAKHDNVVMTGFQKGVSLNELYSHAGLFVLPSSHEGLPIALLEALSYGLPVIASDIPSNLEIELSAEHYFPLGDISLLSERLRYWSEKHFTDEEKQGVRVWVAEKYNWDSIAAATLSVYRSVLNRL